MSKKNKKTTSEKIPLVANAAVLYTDGSAMPNPGYGGWSVCGYSFNNTVVPNLPKTQSKNIPTNYGYKHLDCITDEMRPVKKIDEIQWYGGAVKPISNNTEMELDAIYKALCLVKEQDYKEVTILSDSEVSINALGHWYDKWSANNWYTTTGKQVSIKNEAIRNRTLFDELKDGREIRVRHVKAHSGEPGNELADSLAKKGSKLCAGGKTEEFKLIGDPPTKTKVDYHKFFSRSRWYFLGGSTKVVDYKYNDWYYYCCGSLGNGKGDEDFGARTADGNMALIFLKEKDAVLDKVQSMYNKQCAKEYEYVVCARLDTILTPANYTEIENNDGALVIYDKSLKTLTLPNGRLVCMEYNPPHLSFIQMARYKELFPVFDRWSKGDILKLDITDILKNQVNDLPNSQKDVSYKLLVGDKECEVKLTFGVDFAPRPHLKSMFKQFSDIKFEIVYSVDKTNAVEYYLFASTPNAVGIWYNYNSSLLLL